MMAHISDSAEQSSDKLRAAFMAPGMAIGAFGIIIAILVELFAVVARMKRRKGHLKAAQLTCQNILFVTVFLAVDIYVIVSFLLALVFMFIAALQFSLVMLCKVDIGMCTVVKLGGSQCVNCSKPIHELTCVFHSLHVRPNY